MNIQHVIPKDDVIPHTEFCNEKGICECDCKPKYEEIKEPFGYDDELQTMKWKIVSVVIIHNSFDGREGVEWVNEVLNPQICYKTGKPCECKGLCRESY